MALSLKDRVRESSSTTGTGTITLSGAYPGYQSFTSAVSDGDTVYYTIHNTASASIGEWEVGIGTFTASGTTLSRDTILSSSNSGSAVNFSAGTKEVFITQPSDKAVFEDASNNVTVGGKITVGAAPTNNLVVATKEYVDNATAAALHYHDPVRVESPTALTATYNNGSSGVGATLTNSGTQAALVIDGITMATSDRVLIYTQVDQTQNGVYTVTDIGSDSTNWVLTRATDADTYNPSDPDAMGQGDAFFVLEGDTGAGESYVLTTQGTITFGTTDITYSQFAASPQPGDGTLTMSVSGTGLSGSQTFTANQTGNATFTVTSNATNADTASTIVARDASGNFSAGTITADLSGTATNATNVALTNTSTSSTFYIPFASGNTTGNYALGVDSGLYYNPSLNQLFTSYLTVSGVGYFTTGVRLFGDDDYVVWGASEDAKMFYDGVNNTMEMELESAANSFIITDNGTTRFTFTKATGDLAATSFTGDLTGNADTATSLETARTIGGVSFDGTANINLSGVNTAGNQDTSGNAATATALQTARNIGGVSFDGTADINLPGVNAAGNQDTTGNAATATSATSAGTATNAINVNVATSTTASAFKVPFANTTASTTGNYALLQDSTATFTYNPNTNVLTVGSVTGDLTGNADTATTATTATTANQVSNSVSFGTGGGDTAPISFDGSVARSVSYNTVGAPSTSGTNATGTWGISITGNAGTATSATSATNATNATNADNVALTATGTSANFYIPFASGNTTGDYALGIDSGLYYNPSLNSLTTSYYYGSYSYISYVYPIIIDFGDGTSGTEHLRFGSSDDAKFFYDGTANTMEMELEASAVSFIITDNGTTRFTFDKSSGDFTATGDVNADNLVTRTSSTGSAELPSGTTAQRDGSPSAGYIRFNSDDGSFEGYDGSAWGAIGGGGGATGGGSDAVFYENEQTVTTNYTISTNKSAMSAGPITINSGITVTIPTGSRWVVV